MREGNLELESNPSRTRSEILERVGGVSMLGVIKGMVVGTILLLIFAATIEGYDKVSKWMSGEKEGSNVEKGQLLQY